MSSNTNQRAEHATVFGPGCHIKGEVGVEGDAAVLGSIEGAVEATGQLEIAAEGGIKGNVNAGTMRIEGRVEGDVYCEGLLELNGRIEGDVICGKIDLGSDATLVGNLRAKIIAVREGAIYRGEVIIGPEAMDEAPAGQSQQSEQDTASSSNGQQHEPKPNGPRNGVSGLLRKRHEMLSS